jgi:hypothetical protein
MTPKVVCALASPIGKSAAPPANMNAQTSPVFRVEVIAPSPDVLIIVEERLSRLRLRHKRTHRLVVRALTVFWAVCP